MPVLTTTPAEMNRANREFWKAEGQNFERRAADPLVFALAMEDLKSDMARAVPLYSQITLESALAKAEKLRNRIRSEDGRRGGRPRQGNALQGLIEEIVAKSPNIAVPDLLDRLRELEYGEIIEEVEDGKIYFKHGERESRSATISGLKDRLTRARKAVKARKPVSANS